MFRAFISDQFTDCGNAQCSLAQRTTGLAQFNVLDDLQKGTSSSGFDQSAEMRSAVSKVFGSFVQSDTVIILV